MTTQSWEVAALILLGAFAGVALPALWELRSTLRAARLAIGTTGKRLDVALEAWTQTATRVNRVAAELTDGTDDIKSFLSAVNDFSATIQALRSQIHVATAIGAAVAPAVAAAINAFRAPEVAPHEQGNGSSRQPIKENTDG